MLILVVVKSSFIFKFDNMNSILSYRKVEEISCKIIL